MAESVNQKAIIWARGHKGKQVDRGECWDLANRALRSACGKSSGDFGPVGEDDDYVWGDKVALKDVIPGDILQFRDFTVTTETVIEKQFSDGSSQTDSEQLTNARTTPPWSMPSWVRESYKSSSKMWRHSESAYSATCFSRAACRQPRRRSARPSNSVGQVAARGRGHDRHHYGLWEHLGISPPGQRILKAAQPPQRSRSKALMSRQGSTSTNV